MAVRTAALLIGTALTGVLTVLGHFTFQQVLASATFIMMILATLLFWQFRLAIAFVGITLLLMFRVLTIETLVNSAQLDIILFLVGMMIIIGVLKELGLFTWIIQGVLGMKNMTGFRFTVILMLLSALMACLVDEVTSIIFISALVFQVCDTLKLRPTPFLIIAVLATNIGSSGTMLGNPIGVLIGYRAGLTFMDFMMWTFPVMMVVLVCAMAALLLWYRKDIALLSERLKARREMGRGLGTLVRVPFKQSLLILVVTIGLIASHHTLEKAMGVSKNTLLIMAPLFVAGVLMAWRHERARHYVEKEVEWWTLTFFMLLFASVGSLEHTGVTRDVAAAFGRIAGGNLSALTPAVLGASAIGSAFLDNVVLVAAVIPVIKEIGGATPLWWALLFGGCLGGNITMIGSTANIVALGLLEKRYRMQIRFGEWLKVGALVGVVTCFIAWLAITLLTPLMPETKPGEAGATRVESIERE